MKPGSRSLLGATLLLFTVVGPTWADVTLEREFSLDPARVRIEQAGGSLRVSLPGGMREFRPGRPDLPWQAERIDVPLGMRVRAVEVIGIESRRLPENGSILSAIRPTPGLGTLERTEPDRAYFGHRGFLPDPAVELGAQGFQRGANVALINLSPVRWDPASGNLEALTRVRVRILLEPSAARPLPRERVVGEWESSRAFARPEVGTPFATRATPSGGGKIAQPFQATQIPSLMGSPVEYLIITDTAMEPEFQRLADWKTESGVPAAVRTMTFIRQEYPGGADDAERIRNFIRDAYTRWGTKWVLLGGDTDVLPARFGRTSFYGGTDIATDLYYQCLDGNWNADGDHLYGEGYFAEYDPGDNADLMPDVFVGRAPCVTQAQAQLFVNKTLKYEKAPISDYMKDVLLFAEVLFPQDWEYPQETILDGGSLAELVMPYLQANPNIHAVRLYENYTSTEWKPGALPETRQAVLDSLNRGYNVAVHIGHGYRNVMHVADGTLENTDAFTLSNGDRLINLYAINCTSNAIDFPSIGEAFLLCPTGGAVTNIGSTHFDFPSAGQVYEDEYFRLVYQDSVTAVGEAHALSKLPFIGYSIYDGVNRWTQMTLLMLGDPELRLFTNAPRVLAVTHAGTMSASDTAFAVHVQIGSQPLYGARVTAYKAGMDYRVGTTNGAGNVTLDFRPDTTGNFRLTVVAYDCIPYQATVTLTAPSPPTLSAGLPLIDDDAIGGTSGNGNGIVDAGEIVDLKVPMRNNGGSTASSVTASLTTTDPEIQITAATCNYGTLNAGGTSTPSTGFRFHALADVGDQREIPFDLVLTDAGGRCYRLRLQLVVRAPELRHFSHTIDDQSGNGNGLPEAGELIVYYVKLRNVGTGGARGVTGKLRNFDAMATVYDSTVSWGNIATGQEAQGDALVFGLDDQAAQMELEITDLDGVVFTQMLDLTVPQPPVDLVGVGSATSIALQWTRNPEEDLLGYNCYRSANSNGPFTKINPVPTDRIALLTDAGLTPLTRYHYKVAAVDSSGNESFASAVTSASTNPPLHTIFPIPMARETPSSVAIDHIYPGYPVGILAGSDVLYMLHPDGQAPIDADGAGSTHGDFTRRGSYYAAGPTIADIDGGEPEIIGLSWGTNPNPSLPGDSMMVIVFDKEGNVKPGWPQPTLTSVWSSAAVGDVDGVGDKEIVFGSNGNQVYAFHADGTELLDGDNNPATVGVFRTVGNSFNFSTPAIADLDNDGVKDIIYGSSDGFLYAWHADSTNVPGFPVNLHGAITASPAVGYLDGPSDTQLDIVVPTATDSLFVLGANGARRAGYPKNIEFSGTSKVPSPALADMNNDGFLDIVVASTGGGIYVYQHNGFFLVPWLNARYSAMTSYSSESSPVVADINGDGKPDVVMGDEEKNLAALSNGTMLPGFPIVLNGEVRGTPGLCDCDGDGMSEIVLADWDRNLYMWDYDFPFSPGHVPPWPQFHHDAARTGLASNPVFVGVGGPPPAAGAVTLEFSAPSPNPARSTARASYSVPASSAGAPYEIAVFDVSGRRVQTLDRGIARPGTYTATWNLRSTGGEPVGDGLYFLRITLGSLVESRKVAVVH
jgi:hypothetical protein